MRFVDVLERMECLVHEEKGGIRVVGKGRLGGVDIDMNKMPDVVPTLAVTALFADSPTHIRNIAHLRYKESNRLEALVSELTKLGATITATADGLAVSPSHIRGAQLDTFDDHRLAMSFALAGLRVPGVTIENPGCVSKSFPRFWHEWEKLTAKT
jgi:3-phosphoshikimate 1-carboxyvinyltransferase